MDQDNSRRGFMKGLLSVGSGLLLVEGETEALAAERKPLTQAGIVKSLLSLADRAAKDGFAGEAKLLMELAGRMLREVK